MQVTNSTRVIPAVQTGRADLGLVEGHERGEAEPSALEVGGDRLAVVVHPDHPWARHATMLSALAAAEDLADGHLAQVAVAGLDLSRSLRAIWVTRRGLGPLARRLLAAAGRSAERPPVGGAQKDAL